MKVRIDILELRRELRAKCDEIIDDNDIAEMFYDRLIKIEDHLSFEDVTETQTPQPEIIRCKDCRHWIPAKFNIKGSFIPDRCERNGGYWEEDSYCSNAERR